MAHEDLIEQADAEICRLLQAEIRTRKLSSSTDGSWGFPPVRVGRRQVKSGKISRDTGLFLYIKRQKEKIQIQSSIHDIGYIEEVYKR